MKMRATVALVLCGLIMIWQVHAQAPSSQSHVITPGVSLGPIKLGMKREAVIAEFGEPLSKPNPNALQYSESIAITFDKADKVSMIACGWWCFGETPEAMNHPFKGYFSSGIKMGDPKKKIREQFGMPSKTRMVDEKQAFESWHYPGQGVVLSFKQDALSHVAIISKKARVKSGATLANTN